MECFQVELATAPGDAVPFVAALRTVGRISLAQAVAVHRYACDHPRAVLAAGLARAVADHIAATMAAAGTQVVVARSATLTPMVCLPAVDTPYRWNGMRRVVETTLNPEDLQS